jgi:S-adenosylmethionine hydrolase
VIHIDHYGNAVLNLSAKTFVEARQDRNFVIYLRGGGVVTKISETYHEVPEGEAVCLFNREGLLEIAVNAGRADGLLALKRGESVRIDFE